MNTSPGTSTTEFKLSAAVVTVITVLYGAFMALTSANVLHVPQAVVAAATAIYPVVTGGVVVNYSWGRTQLKLALISATTQQSLASAQVSAPDPTLTNATVTNANAAAALGLTQTSVAAGAPPLVTMPVNPAPVPLGANNAANPPAYVGTPPPNTTAANPTVIPQ